ncbi:hypothetical protein D1007_36337 [Hordeum vulgare]|nr:hypothetical protein D1007_36337 [Hordeum vulgare]
MAAATTTTALSMKLLIDTKARRVLFAEASKDLVDFLFSLLALPVGTAVKLLGNDAMVGCVGSLYDSVERLDDTYVQPDASKDVLLHPSVLSPMASSKSSLLGLPAPPSPEAKTFYRCSMQCNCYNGDDHALHGRAVGQAAAGESGKGFVQGIMTYTVMDDLTMTPMSSISSITLLNTLAIRDLAALQEKTVQLGYDQCLDILKASLQSKTVLTDFPKVGWSFCIATASYAAPATTPKSLAAVRLHLPTGASSFAWSRCVVRAAVRCEFAAATASSTASPAIAPGSSEERRGHELGVQAPPPDLLPRLIDHLHAIPGYGSVPCHAEIA